MVRGDAVAQHQERTRIVNALATGGRPGTFEFKVRGTADVRAGDVPGEEIALGGIEPFPLLIALKEIGIARFESGSADVRAHHVLYLVRVRPDVFQEHWLARLVFRQWLARQVDPHVARDRISDHQRRRHQVVAAYLQVDPRLEIAISRQHGANVQILFAYG